MGWFDDLDRLIRSRWSAGDEFTLAEVYELAPELRRLYPENTTIEASIRAVLQDLRDQGRLEFLEKRGSYRILDASDTSRRLPDSSRENILLALERFDRDLRGSDEWKGWQSDATHKYALRHEDRLYPVKMIVSLATGVSRTEFSGGAPANNFVRRYGFSVERLRESPSLSPATSLKWWVNQGSTFQAERSGGYVWAPKETKAGTQVQHHKNVSALQVGDRIVHYANGQVRAVGTVQSLPVEAQRPEELPKEPWGREGFLAKVSYQDLAFPFSLDAIPVEWRRQERGPFNSTGAVNQGYLFPLSPSFASQLEKGMLSETKEPKRSRAWIFQANPNDYDLSSALQTLSAMTWEVNQHKAEIHTGDTAYLWLAGDNGGIVAAAEVRSEPDEITDDPPERAFWKSPERGATPSTRVKLAVTLVLPSPVSRLQLKQTSGLEQLSILRFAQGTNFPVSATEQAVIDQLLRGVNASIPGARPGARYWAIAPGEGARLWQDFLDGSHIAIGWDRILDLRQYKSQDDVAEALKVEYERDGYPTNDSLACYQFANELAIGDVVFAKRGVGEVLGFGVVTGDYDHQPSRDEYPNVRTVRWLGTEQWRLPDELRLPIKALTDISKYDEMVQHLVARATGTVMPEPESPTVPPYTIDDALEGLFMPAERLRAIIDTLARKRNIVLQGPPGVGKTFVAKRVAYALMGHKDPSRLEMVQFHQSYAYEDFVQGWRPTETGGFALRDGVFYTFCRRASEDLQRPWVFIVDEINRANLSKVLGELMMLIEADKRGADYSVPLTYARDATDRFFVPPNVYIIGLMNTADRSLAMVDYALRRRFGFIDLIPALNGDRFRGFLEDRGAPASLVDLIVARIGKLNDAITNDEKSLGAGFQIGHSYFCPQGTEAQLDEDWFRDVIDSEVGPLLREYWFDDPRKADDWVARLKE